MLSLSLRTSASSAVNIKGKNYGHAIRNKSGY